MLQVWDLRASMCSLQNGWSMCSLQNGQKFPASMDEAMPWQADTCIRCVVHMDVLHMWSSVITRHPSPVVDHDAPERLAHMRPYLPCALHDDAERGELAGAVADHRLYGTSDKGQGRHWKVMAAEREGK